MDDHLKQTPPTRAELLQAARGILSDCTPLQTDCGKRCGAACCQSDAEGKGGMLLFPGEEAFYTPAPAWARVRDSGLDAEEGIVYFLECDGTCPREHRPLACRIFPLTPILRDGSLHVQLDTRAWPICPLMPHGMRGLSTTFISSVQSAMRLLYAHDAEMRSYMALLTEQLRAFASFSNFDPVK